MDVSVEISRIDLRYQHCRLSHGPNERRLLAAISEQGIYEPVTGVIAGGAVILLDGFKRYRCAHKLGIATLAFRSLGDDEAAAILALMRRSNAGSLSFLEQARLIDELRRVHGLSVGDIARRLERSPAWVSVRQGLVDEMTPLVGEKIMSGAFPMHAYLASVRPITRVNRTQPAEIEAFVKATAGKGLSVRELDVLARGYFHGGDEIRQQVERGDVSLCLSALRESGPCHPAASNERERRLLADLDYMQRRMRRLPPELSATGSEHPKFLAEAHVYCGGIRRLFRHFLAAIEEFYDRTRPAQSRDPDACQGHES